MLDPVDFGLVRSVDLGSRFTGRHAVEHRAAALNLHLSGEEVCQLTSALKERAEHGALNQEEVDAFIHQWYNAKRSLVWERYPKKFLVTS